MDFYFTERNEVMMLSYFYKDVPVNLKISKKLIQVTIIQVSADEPSSNIL